jgi:DNA polymerase-3 subunit alpha
MATIKTIAHQDMSFIKDEVNIQTGIIKDGSNVIIVGSITSITTKTTRSSQIMAFISVEDLTGSLEIIVFPNVLNKFKELIKVENIIVISGKVSLKEEEEPKILADDIVPISAKKQKSIKVFANEKTEKRIIALCSYFSGNFLIVIDTNGNEIEKRIEYSAFITEELMDIAGKENVMMS